jgi:pimeloyl-ACP methyl ester carboxylesterase
VQIASTDGVTLALHDLGGDGPPLLVCPATGFPGRAYAPMARYLAHRYHVYGLDFRGHGASSEPASGSFDWGGMAEDVLASVDAIGSPSVRAFGHSMGGASILLAELARPGTITAAYLFEPIVIPPESEITTRDNIMATSARKRREVFGSREEALYRYASRPPLGELRADALAAYVEHGFVDQEDGTVRLACRAESEARTFEATGKMTAEMAPSVRSPILVGIGDRGEPPNPASFAPFLVDALPAGRLLSYAHLGHFGPLQDPVTVADDMLLFFDGT